MKRCLPGFLVAVAGKEASLDFLDCTGDSFHPAWRRFQENLPSEVNPGTPVPVEEASELLSSVEAEEDFDWAQAVSDFSLRLRGDLTTQDLGGFCLFGVVTAYAVLSYQLVRETQEIKSDAKNLLVRALITMAKKQVNDFLESSSWPVRSLDMVALLGKNDYAKVRDFRLDLPCWLRLGCPRPKNQVQALIPPLPPLEANWPSKVVAVGLHTTSTLEVVTALRDALSESWGRGGAGGAPFEIQYAGHPCPSHSGSEHHCAMRCELLNLCSVEEDANDPLAEWVAGAVDVAHFEERESYTLEQARSALRWAPRRLEPLRKAELILCTFPTVLCVLLHELFPETPQLYVSIANPLFAAPGCTQQEDSTVRDCETPEAQEFLKAFRSMLAKDKPVRGVAAYTVTTALVAYQAGVVLPLAGKAGRYLPPQAFWRGPQREEVLVARSRFLETGFGAAFRNLASEFKEAMESTISFTFQQEAGTYLSYEALSGFRSVIIFAQDLGLHKFTEHYAMGMPIWVPCREMAYRLQMMVPWGMVSYSGSWRHAGPSKEKEDPNWWGQAPSEVGDATEAPELAFRPFFHAQSFPYPLADAAYWYEFGEFVSYPGVQEFTSMPQLLEALQEADLWQISSVMRQFRAWLWHNTRDVYAAAASELATVAR